MKMNLEPHREKIVNDLTTQGWTVLDDFFDPELIVQLALECCTQHQLGLLKQAGIGRSDQLVVEKTIRSDQIRWLETGMSASGDDYLEQMELLLRYFNRQLYLGLQDSEQHFAFYPEGAFYQKHLDRFRDEDRRTVSSVLYLNADWRDGDGGELRLHLEDKVMDIAPLANRYVLFMSAQIVHEVMPSNTSRLSLTGWFKRRP